MKAYELKEASTHQLHAKLEKLDKVIATHPQRSMRAKAGGTKAVVLNELTRRGSNTQ